MHPYRTSTNTAFRWPAFTKFILGLILSVATVAGAAVPLPAPPTLTATESIVRAAAPTRVGRTVTYTQKESWRLNFTATVPVNAKYTLDSQTVATMLAKGGISVAFGDYTVSAPFTGAVVNSTRRTAVVAISNGGDTTVPGGTVTVAWTDKGFTLVGNLAASAASFVYGEGEDRRINDVTAGGIHITGNTGSSTELAFVDWQALKVGGTQTFTTRTIQGEDFILGSRVLTVTADSVRPTVTILAPARDISQSAARLTDADVILSGIALDNREVNSVVVVMDGGDEQPADFAHPTTAAGDDVLTRGTWSFNAGPLTSGLHVFEVYSVDAEGLRSVSAIRRITYVKYVNLHLTLDGSGSVTPAFLSAATGNVTRRQVGAAYTIVATPAAGYSFAGWSGDLDGLDHAGPSLTFTTPDQDPIELTARFIPNPFTDFVGDYTVQFGSADDAISLDSIGGITFSMTATGLITGKLVTSDYESGVSFKAQVSGDGTVTVDIPYQPLATGKTAGAVKHVHLELTLDLSDPSNPDISGTVTGIDPKAADELFSSDIAGYRKVWSNASPVDSLLQGAYTFEIATDASDANGFNLPDGFATGKLTADGNFTITGTLPTGVSFTTSRALSPEGIFYVRQATPAGIITGQVQVEAGADQPQVTASLYLNYAYYDEELLQTVFVQVPFNVTAEPYTVPATDTLAVPLSDGTGTITITTYAPDDDQVVSTDIVKNFTLAANGTVTITDDNAENVTLTVTNATGAFTGTFKNPATGATVSFKGALLQDALEGHGQYYIGTSGGPVSLGFQVGSAGDGGEVGTP